MRPKKDVILILGLTFAALLCLFLSNKNPRPESRYFANKEEDCLSYGCVCLNSSLSEEYSLSAGDDITITLVRNEGQFDIGVEGKNGTRVYAGTDLDTGSFTVTVPEDGVYCLTVSGTQARGSISFQMK